MIKLFEKIVRLVVNILTAIVLVCIIVMLYGKIEMSISNRSYSNYFGYTFFKVVTGSMGSVVKIDDVVIVKITKDVKENEIITYQENNNFITHRVTKVGKTYITAKGDSNNTEDQPVLKENIVGRVVCILDGFGIWQRVFSNPQILISIFITLILFDVAFTYRDKKEEKKYMERKKSNSIKKIDRDLTDTQILKMDYMLEVEKAKRKAKKKKKVIQEEGFEKLTREQIEESLGKTQVLLIQPVLNEKDNSNELEILDTQIIPIQKNNQSEEKIEILATQNIPVQKIQEEIELLETKKIPVEEIKKQRDKK